jgi:hypothetical protein
MVLNGKIIYAALSDYYTSQKFALPCFRHYFKYPMARSRPITIEKIGN